MLTTKQRATGDVPAPASGHATLFVEDDVVKVKLSDDSVLEVGPAAGGGASNGLTPIGVGWFNPMTATILGQNGTLFESIIRSGAGNYYMTMSQSYEDSTFIAVLITPEGSAPRFCTYVVAGDALQVFVFDAAGAAADVTAFSCAVFAPPEAP